MKRDIGPVMSGLALRGRFLLLALGPVGWFGGVLLIAALVALLAWAPRLHALQAETQEQIRQTQAHLDTARASAREDADRDPLQVVISRLAPATHVPEFLEQLESSARESGVQIDRSEYQVHPELGRRVLRYQVNFPAHADYPHLRSWLSRLLARNPALVLDELSVERLSEGGEELEVHLTLSLLISAKP